MGESGKKRCHKSRTALARKAPHPPLTRSPFPQREGLDRTVRSRRETDGALRFVRIFCKPVGVGALSGFPKGEAVAVGD